MDDTTDEVSDAQKNYETHFVAIDPKERRRSIGIATIFVSTITGGILFESYQRDQILETGWICIIYLIPYCAFVTYKLLKTHEKQLTKEGMIAKAQDEVANALAKFNKSQSRDARFESYFKLFDRPSLRYPIGITLLIFAFYSTVWQSIDKGSVAFSISLFGVALWFMREVVIWIIGISILCGIGYLIFGWIAALPVSVAIIIGAWIIASSSKN